MTKLLYKKKYMTEYILNIYKIKPINPNTKKLWNATPHIHKKLIKGRIDKIEYVTNHDIIYFFF